MSPALLLRAISVSCLLGCVGCIPSWDPSMLESSDGKVATGGNEEALSACLGTQAYRGNGFTKLDGAHYESTLEPGALINIYVSKFAATAYEEVTPDGNSGGSAFPVGGVLVREVVDANDNPTELTAMIKREPGFFPAVGDFFFGVADTGGNPKSDASGNLQWGALQFCAACHEGRSSSGFMFGVATANRGGGPSAAASALVHASVGLH